MDISIRKYKETDRDALVDYKLNEQQQIYSSLPLDVLDDALKDDDRTANIVVADDCKIVGFFVLHKHYQHEGYDTPHEVVYVRSLSINEQYQGNGYGTKVAQYLPVYVQENFSQFDHLYLVVDGENQGAWNLYERAGFLHTATKEDGPIGKERLYYLDLARSYVPNLKVVLDEEAESPNVQFNLVLDDLVAGHIDGEITEKKLLINNIFVEEEFRERGIAESAVRQLGTAVRKYLKTVDTVEVFVSESELTDIFTRAGFVHPHDTSEENHYQKLVRY